MTELAAVLHSFVEQPTAPPPPIDVLLDRGRVRRRKRVGIAFASATSVLIVIAASIAAMSGQRAITITASGPDAQSAAYRATAPGGYEGKGVWRLTVVRDGRTTVYTNEASPPCGKTGTIRPGDRVFAAIETPESLLRVGAKASCPPP